MKLKTKTRISLLFAVVVIAMILFCARVCRSPILGAGKAFPGDVVVVRIEPYVATGKVISVTERFDDKRGAYTCYRIDFGKLENGESDIQTIPFRFVKKVKNGSSLELDNCKKVLKAPGGPHGH